MTRQELYITLIEAQANRPAGLIAGTSNWADYMADAIIKAEQAKLEAAKGNEEPDDEPELDHWKSAK